MDKRGERKAQITLFILLSIILLGAAVTAYLLLSRGGDPGGPFKDVIMKEVPSEMVPITSYVDKCLLDTSIDAVILAGKQGGYTYPGEWGIQARWGLPTAGNAINHPVFGKDVPYYFHLASPNDCSGDCVMHSGIPFLRAADGSPSIEAELAKYVERNIGNCLNDLITFSEREWDIEIKGAPRVEAAIAGDDVLFRLNYPFRAQRIETSSHEAVDFIIRVPVNLKNIYEQAYIIWRFQSDNRFLENHIMNVVASAGYSDTRPEGLPPVSFSRMVFGDTNYWVEIDVENKVKDLLERDISFLQMEGTLNHIIRTNENPSIEAMMGPGMTLPNHVEDAGISVTFSYFRDWWERIYFKVCPGGVCKPKVVGVTVPMPIGYSQYHFKYDISNPVLVELFDPSALGSKGYRFLFALESNIRNNRPLGEGFVDIEPVALFPSIGSELFCDPNQRNSGEITIRVVDGDGNPVEDAAVVYADGDNACPIGKTGDDGILVSSFPAAMGGIVSVVREGYSSFSQVFPTYLGEERELDVQVFEIMEVPFRVKGKRLYHDGLDWYHLASSRISPLDEDHIYVLLERVQGPGEEQYMAFSDVFGDESSTLRLYPGTYRITAYGVHEADWTLHDEVCYDTGGGLFGGSSTECTPISIDFNSSLLIAGLDIEYTFTYEEIASGKELIIWTTHLNRHHISTLDDLDVLERLEEVTTIYRSDFIPTWE